MPEFVGFLRGVHLPLDTDATADFDSTCLCTRSQLDDLSDALVSSDLAWLRGIGKAGPSIGLSCLFSACFSLFIVARHIPSPRDQNGKLRSVSN